MSALESLLRFSVRLVRHPVSQTLLKHAIRLGTAELVRQVQKRTKAGVNSPHHIH